MTAVTIVKSLNRERRTSVRATIVGEPTALQAVVGGLLVRRLGDWPNLLSETREIALLLLYGGLLACLINASVGSLALWFAGMIPAAASLSGDDSFRGPMGTVVIGGLCMSTVLTLLIVPAAFSLADGFEKRIGPMLVVCVPSSTKVETPLTMVVLGLMMVFHGAVRLSFHCT